VDNTNEYMDLDHNRCILCGRCVRACREIAGNYVLNYQNRGAKSLICKDLNEPTELSGCDASGVCLQVCPTGAIFNRMRMHYAVKGKAKDLQVIESACPQCGLLCPTVTKSRDNNLVRIDGVLNTDRPDRGQLCQKGRFEPLKSKGPRLLVPMIRGWDGSWIKASWEMVLDLVAKRLSAVRARQGGDRIFGLASADCCNEEFMIFRDLMKEGFGAGHLDTLGGGHVGTIARAWKDLARTVLAVRETSWKRIPEADLILLAGVDPEEDQSLISSLARRGVMEKGTQVAVMGPTDILHPWSSLYVPGTKKNLPVLVKALLAEVVAAVQTGTKSTALRRIAEDLGGVKAADLLKRPGLERQAREAVGHLASAFALSKAPMIIAGSGASEAEDASCLRDLMYLALTRGLLPENALRLVILKPGGNAAAALKLGMMPNGSAKAPAKWKAGMLLLNGEEISDPKLLSSLAGLDFLAAVSPYVPDAIGETAHVLIPKPAWLEMDGTYTSLDGQEGQYVKRVLDPPPGVRSAWETLSAVARGSAFRPDFSDWEGLRGKAMREMNLGA
jgi:predicted molibdopterin-dependent oxidoreductase YjgC